MEMEHNTALATGLSWLQGDLYATLSNSTGGSELVKVGELADRGIPKTSAKSTKSNPRIKTDFSNWECIKPTEYFSIDKHPFLQSIDIKHQVFSFTKSGRRYVIPALVLIRAVILPRRYFFEDAFHSNFLEKTIQLKQIDGEFILAIDCPKARYDIAKKINYINSLYGWLASYPSAEKMVNSIHRNARNNYIGIDIPDAIMEARISGDSIGNTIFVNEISISNIQPTESAGFPIAALSTPINIASYDLKKSNIVATDGYVIPRNRNGEIKISEGEWQDIQNIVGFPSSYWTRFKYCPRALLSAILVKLSSGTPWREMDFYPADWRTAATTFRSLHRTGKLNSLINVIQKIRGPFNN
jgi:hypothetical protein